MNNTENGIPKRAQVNTKNGTSKKAQGLLFLGVVILFVVLILYLVIFR